MLSLRLISNVTRLIKWNRVNCGQFHSSGISISKTKAKALSSNLKSRVRIVQDETESLEIVNAIIKLGEPIAVDVEVNTNIIFRPGARTVIFWHPSFSTLNR